MTQLCNRVAVELQRLTVKKLVDERRFDFGAAGDAPPGPRFTLPWVSPHGHSAQGAQPLVP